VLSLSGSNWDYWRQILIDVGGNPVNDDTEWNFAWKTLAIGHATGVNDDTLRDLTCKIVGNPLLPGESLNDIYRRFYKQRLGSDAPPGSSDNDLLRAIANDTITPGFPFSAPSGGVWTLTDRAGGIARITITTFPAGADSFRSKVVDDTTPASSGTETATHRVAHFDYTFLSGDTIHVQIAWFSRGVQLSDWSVAKNLTLA